jgi:hypothetical protein
MLPSLLNKKFTCEGASLVQKEGQLHRLMDLIFGSPDQMLANPITDLMDTSKLRLAKKIS